jgi:hypothetical protein
MIRNPTSPARLQCGTISVLEHSAVRLVWASSGTAAGRQPTSPKWRLCQNYSASRLAWDTAEIPAVQSLRNAILPGTTEGLDLSFQAETGRYARFLSAITNTAQRFLSKHRRLRLTKMGRSFQIRPAFCIALTVTEMRRTYGLIDTHAH